jgi:hypothetical protein
VRWRWITIGALAVLGTFWLFLRLMFALQIWADWVPFAGSILAGAAAGAMIARHAEIKPWREPVIASVVAFAIVIAFWFAFPDVIDGRSPEPLLFVAMGAATLAAAGGAAFVRAFFTTTPSFAVTALLDAQLLGGLTMVTLAVMGASGAPKGPFIAIMIIAIAIAGALTQWVTPVRRVWACSGGGLVLILIILTGSGRDKASAALGFAVLWLVGALGAWLQWKLGKRTEIRIDIPAAKLE